MINKIKMEYIYIMSSLGKTYKQCNICVEYYPEHVMYELRCGHVILMKCVCLECMFRYSPELSNQHNKGVPIPINQ
jgi:hypothetical protein